MAYNSVPLRSLSHESTTIHVLLGSSIISIVGSTSGLTSLEIYSLQASLYIWYITAVKQLLTLASASTWQVNTFGFPSHLVHCLFVNSSVHKFNSCLYQSHKRLSTQKYVSSMYFMLLLTVCSANRFALAIHVKEFAHVYSVWSVSTLISRLSKSRNQLGRESLLRTGHQVETSE